MKLKTFITRLSNQFLKLVKNPFVEWRRIFGRFEARTGIPTHYISPTRSYIKYRESKLLESISDSQLTKLGNYYVLKDSSYDRDSVIYSAGVGNNIMFDRAIHDEYGVKVHMIDPTPNSKTFLDTQNLPSDFIHYPVAIYTYDGEISFYPDYNTDQLDKSSSFSIQNRSKTSNLLTVPCKKLSSIMAENGHDHIDLLKMDIEGAARMVLENTLKEGIYPAQIICELEIPANPIEAIKEVKAIEKLLKTLKSKGYKSYSITRTVYGARIELLSHKA